MLYEEFSRLADSFIWKDSSIAGPSAASKALKIGIERQLSSPKPFEKSVGNALMVMIITFGACNAIVISYSGEIPDTKVPK